jgi:hypothetical protein
MVIGLIAMSGFSKASDGQNLITDAESSVGETGIVRFRNDVDALNAASKDVVDKVFPAFAQELGISDTEFEQRLRATHPEAATAFLDQQGAIFQSIDSSVANLERHQEDYDAADGIPTSWIPLTVMPWLAMAFGLGLIALGVWAWLHPGRGTAVAVAIAGVLMVVFTLGASLPSKGHKAERLLDSLNITEPVAAKTRAEFDTFKAGIDDLRGVFAEFAQARGQTPEEFGATVEQQLPAVAKVANDPTLLDRMEFETRFREEHIDEFAAVKDVPLEAAAWLYVVLGGVLVLSGAVALLLAEGRTAQEVTAAPV